MTAAQEDRIATLSRRVDDLEDIVKKLRREWNDVEEKLGRLAGRLAKRASRELDAAVADEKPNGGVHVEYDEEVEKRRRPRIFPGGRDS